jgi:hypothetical protein
VPESVAVCLSAQDCCCFFYSPPRCVRLTSHLRYLLVSSLHRCSFFIREASSERASGSRYALCSAAPLAPCSRRTSNSVAFAFRRSTGRTDTIHLVPLWTSFWLVELSSFRVYLCFATGVPVRNSNCGAALGLTSGLRRIFDPLAGLGLSAFALERRRHTGAKATNFGNTLRAAVFGSWCSLGADSHWLHADSGLCDSCGWSLHCVRSETNRSECGGSSGVETGQAW